MADGITIARIAVFEGLMTMLLTFMATTALYATLFVLAIRWILRWLQKDAEAMNALRDVLAGLLKPSAHRETSREDGSSSREDHGRSHATEALQASPVSEKKESPESGALPGTTNVLPSVRSRKC
jgi:hypothetical protein